MSGYPDDRDRDDPDRDERERDRDRGDGARDERAVATARAATSAPGTFLILNGLFGMVVAAALSVPMIFQPEMIVQFARDMVANQPQGQQRKDTEDKLDEQEKFIQQNRVAVQIENAIKLGILAAGSLIGVVGGFAMRSLGSYWLSMTGSIVSIIPCITGCCCTGIPFGIWALVVLVRQDVKDGFAARRMMSSGSY
jgi:hypothetical protein